MGGGTFLRCWGEYTGSSHRPTAIIEKFGLGATLFFRRRLEKAASGGKDPWLVIDTFLSAVRDRLRRRQLFGGATTWSSATAGGALLLLISAAALGPSGVWRVLGIGGLLSAAFLAAVGFRKVRLAFASDDAVARWVWRESPAV